MVVVAHARAARETSFKGGAHVDGPLYKTRPCREWEERAGAFCPRGARCDFAHGPLELRLLPSGGAGRASGSGGEEGEEGVGALGLRAFAVQPRWRARGS
jgi:hypothetical protein